MTATSFVAARQSSRDKRFPFTTSAPIPSLTRETDAIRDMALDGRAKQRTFRNPRSNKHIKSLDPMKPVAPVTKIGSSKAMIISGGSADNTVSALQSRTCLPSQPPAHGFAPSAIRNHEANLTAHHP